MKLTNEQLEALASVAQSDGFRAALEAAESLIEDNLAFELLDRGGFATVQLSAPGFVPRMKFVAIEDAKPVHSASIAGVLIHRDAKRDSAQFTG